MIDPSPVRLLSIATIGLTLIARPGLASSGSATPEPPIAPIEVEQAESAPVEAVEILVDPPAREVTSAEVQNDDLGTPADSEAQLIEAEPINNMDRSGWPRIVTTPTDGSVTHNPSYMGNPPMGDDIVTPLHAPDPVWQIQEALAGADAGNLNGENLSALGAQPFIGLAQFLLIPVRAVFEHPWSEVTSP